MIRDLGLVDEARDADPLAAGDPLPQRGLQLARADQQAEHVLSAKPPYRVGQVLGPLAGDQLAAEDRDPRAVRDGVAAPQRGKLGVAVRVLAGSPIARQIDRDGAPHEPPGVAAEPDVGLPILVTDDQERPDQG